MWEEASSRACTSQIRRLAQQPELASRRLCGTPVPGSLARVCLWGFWAKWGPSRVHKEGAIPANVWTDEVS